MEINTGLLGSQEYYRDDAKAEVGKAHVSLLLACEAFRAGDTFRRLDFVCDGVKDILARMAPPTFCCLFGTSAHDEENAPPTRTSRSEMEELAPILSLATTCGEEGESIVNLGTFQPKESEEGRALAVSFIESVCFVLTIDDASKDCRSLFCLGCGRGFLMMTTVAWEGGDSRSDGSVVAALSRASCAGILVA